MVMAGAWLAEFARDDSAIRPPVTEFLYPEYRLKTAEWTGRFHPGAISAIPAVTESRDEQVYSQFPA
jgi:hypothetical protein